MCSRSKRTMRLLSWPVRGTDGPGLSLGAGYGLNQRFRQHIVSVVAHSNNLASVAECRHLFTLIVFFFAVSL